ncbi:hypothetical protein [Halomonas sp. OfavH-34-E]|uniref:hypothetical protein n=1 Tax=Halomonas sp. OfavH-34-E TaxID=2954491 RepID=UPI0020971FC1|nr:hypothetical protein [Halomonas sp. OfavH-34-E]MCO7217819.1 hypothetical protein [Halomonas sp. OfavH-34-E]
MSETKFTPGPWFAYDDHPQHACYHIATADYWHDDLATIYSPGDPEADANASLIAAAPELYEALAAFERVVDLWLPADSEVDAEHYGEAEALAGLRRTMADALAKARGQS